MDRFFDGDKQDYLLDAINEDQYAVAANEMMESSSDVTKSFCRDLLANKVPNALKNENLTVLLLEKLLYLARKVSLERINNIQESQRWRGITVVDCYQALLQVLTRVKCVVEIVNICNKSIVNVLCKEDQTNNTEEFDLDNRAMVIAIEHLEPNADMNEGNFGIWKNIVKLLSSVLSSMSNPSAHVLDKWNKLLIVELFLDDVWMQKCIEGDTRVAVFTKVALLWR